MPDGRIVTCWETDHACPKCGAPLSTQGKWLWCGAKLPDGRNCDYGIAEVVGVDDRKEGGS